MRTELDWLPGLVFGLRAALSRGLRCWILSCAALALSTAGEGRATPAAPAPWLWGVTSDDPTLNTAQQVDALKALPRRATVRLVFDPPTGGHPAAPDYAPSARAFSLAADVMGLPVDSSAMAATSLPAVRARIAEYLEALGPYVSIWEVGNEINGNWLGSDVMPKVEAMFDAVKAAGKNTALTFYHDVSPPRGHGLIPWIDANIPKGHRMREGLSLVLVSYYEDQNQGHRLTQKELDRLFGALAARFPKAQLAIGEFGWGGGVPASEAVRADLLRRFYSYRVPRVPAFAGGGFYWHFRQTMVPKTSPDWSVLNNLQGKAQ
ncbi:MAG: hypothetical protein HY014_14670 [Acidobacteria bacterium]|nr:hypothetical protein [Acidobacteriota bacterium]MBI3489403.1 hypothetical protein [Acidobacteriota bacterium]